MKTIKLDVFGIIIKWNGSDRYSARIVSEMKDQDTKENHSFNSGVDAIESMVLAHFCAGIDVSEPSYKEGIETAYQSLANNIVDEAPCTSSILADFNIQDWHITEMGDEWAAPKEHRDTYRFLIEQSPSTGQIYFSVYPCLLDNLSNDIELNGLSGCIEIRNGKPAMSIGTNESSLPIHIESDICHGIHVHSDTGVDPVRSEFISYDHDMTFKTHYYVFNTDSWIMKVRSELAEKTFSDYDFGSMNVVEDDGWKIDSDHWTKGVYFENTDGGDSIKGHFELTFAANSTVVLFESSNS